MKYSLYFPIKKSFPLSLSFFSLASTNCPVTTFEFNKALIAMYEKNFDGPLLDSLYVDKDTANNRGKHI